MEKPDGQRQQLVAQADAEDRHLAQQPADGLHGVAHRGRVARAVGEEDAVGLQGQRLLGRPVGGDDGDLATDGGQIPEDAALDAEVVGHHAEAQARALSARAEPGARASHSYGSRAGHGAGQVLPGHGREGRGRPPADR